MKILAIVPARCGSKGFPNKNIAKIGGKTLLELAVNVGVKSKIIDTVYVSTDCSYYENIGKSAGAQSMGLRSTELASDTSKSIDAIIDLIQRIDETYDYLVLLQPTSPVRTPEDIEKMCNLMSDKDAKACVSVYKIEEPHPHKMKSINEFGYVQPFIEGTTSEVNRQSLSPIYGLNGAIYITKIETILTEKTFLPKETIPYLMKSNINIDSEEDFIFLEAMYAKDKVKVWGIND